MNVAATYAGSATWLASPQDNRWENPANWTTGSPPSESATFATSSRTGVVIGTTANVSDINFTQGASAFTIAISPGMDLYIFESIANSSDTTQNFLTLSGTPTFGGRIDFLGANAGTNTVFTCNGAQVSFHVGSSIGFSQGASGGHGTFLVNGGMVANSDGAYIQFFDSSNAGFGTFTVRCGATSGASGGFVDFENNSSGANGQFLIKSASQSDVNPGFVRFFNQATAGTANFTVEGVSAVGAAPANVSFYSNSTAGAATFESKGAAAANELGGIVQFFDSTAAGAGAFTADGGQISEAWGGTFEFFNTSGAGNATFVVNEGQQGDAFGGRLEFWDNTNAGSANITINHPPSVGQSRMKTKLTSLGRRPPSSTAPASLIATSGGAVYFIGQSSAGSAHFTSYGGGAAMTGGGLISFADNATANSGVFTTRSGEVADSSGAEIYFEGNSIAGNGVFHTKGRRFAGLGTPRILFFDSAGAANANFDNTSGVQFQFYANSSAGAATFTFDGPDDTNPYASSVDFWDNASAGTSSFTMSGAANNTASPPHVGFFSSATAGSAHFILNPGTVDGAIGGRADFRNESTAAESVFTLNGGPVEGAVGGLLQFLNTSTAGDATLVANDGAPGPRGGGRIFFLDDSTGGKARIIVHGIGKLDLSLHNPGSVSIGFLEGDGNVFLGSYQLAVAVPSQFFSGFSGVIQDGGFNGGVGGSLAITDGGWLSLGNANTYTGGTTVNSGILEVAHDGGLGTGDVSVASGANLLLDKGATNNYIADTAALKIVTGSTVHLAFNGNPEVIASLILDGVPQPGGLYGSTTSGAPHPLPQFRDEGTILVVNTQAASRKAHGAVFFETMLPFSGKPAVECRSGGANGDYQLVVTFSRPVTYASAAVTSGTGSVQSTSGNNSSAITINLTGVANAQTIIVTVSGVNYGGNTGNIRIPVSFLIGDTSGNGSVNASDVSQTKSQSGQSLTGSNFREDVTANGSINTSDVSLVKVRVGTSLP